LCSFSKGVVVTERIDKRQRYSVAFTREAYIDQVCQDLVDRLFDGDHAALVRRLLERSGWTAADVASLSESLERLRP